MSAELAARRTAAAAALTGFRRWYGLGGRGPDHQRWAVRLAAELQSLLTQLDAEPEANHQVPRVDGSIGVSHVRPDGSASLSRQDRLTILGAIATAAEYLENRAGLICADCEADVAEICDTHASDLDAAAQYRAVAERLGEDR